MARLHSISRRTLLAGGCVATLSAVAAKGWAAAPQSQGRKLVFIILRGAMDGLALLPKTDDPDIMAHRGVLVDPKAAKLGDGFALHSALPGLATMYQAKEAAFIPAAAGPYRERSHFEAQDLLECGGVRQVSSDGWLNRALQKAPGAYSAVSIGPAQPLILRGAATRTSSWSPPVLPDASDDTLKRLLDLYEGDKLLKPALVSALGDDKVANGMGPARPGMGQGGRGGEYGQQLEAAGNFLSKADGPELAVVGLDGWDTHAGQNGALQQRFTQLDQGLGLLKQRLGDTWKKTAVIAVSEFGRTVRVNGGQGTDHGTAGTVILAGGAVRGGRIIGDWPGLKSSALFENRDLNMATDVRSAFKGLLRDHLGWSAADLDREVFPESASAKASTNLV